MSTDLVEILQDIRERVIKIETVLERHVEDDLILTKQVQKNTKDIIVAKTSLSVLKWVSSIIMVTIPAIIFTILRIFKS